MRIRRITLALLILMPDVSLADLASEYDAARLRWKNAHVFRYSYEYRDTVAGMFSPPCRNATVRTTVSGRSRGSLIVVDSMPGCRKGSVLTGQKYEHTPRSVDDLFNLIHGFIPLESSCRTVVVTYDERFGFPTSFESVDDCVTHGDWGFEVKNFRKQN